MPDINQTFTNLLLRYDRIFSKSTHTGNTRSAMRTLIPSKAGVYIISRIEESNRPLYIGSSGKIARGLVVSGSSIRSRLFAASTPYKFEEDVFRFGPTTAGVPPDSYTNAVSLKDLQILCFVVTAPKIPAVWEHLLIQGFINEFGDLPIANQKI